MSQKTLDDIPSNESTDPIPLVKINLRSHVDDADLSLIDGKTTLRLRIGEHESVFRFDLGEERTINNYTTITAHDKIGWSDDELKRSQTRILIAIGEPEGYTLIEPQLHPDEKRVLVGEEKRYMRTNVRGITERIDTYKEGGRDRYLKRKLKLDRALIENHSEIRMLKLAIREEVGSSGMSRSTSGLLIPLTSTQSN